MTEDLKYLIEERFNHKILTPMLLILMILSIFSTSSMGIWTESYSVLFTYPFFCLLIYVLFDKETRFFTFLSFFCYVFISHCLIYSFYSESGKMFIGGGDDELFYNQSINFSQGRYSVRDDFYQLLSSKAYMHFLGKYVSFLNIIGFQSKSYLSDLLMVNSLIGSLSIAFLFKALRGLYSPKLLGLIFLLLSFFPTVIYYSSVLLRDVCFMLVVTVIIYAFLKIRNTVFQLIVIGGVLLIASQLRMASAVMISVLPIAYYFQGIKSNFVKSILLVLGILGLISVLSIFKTSFDIERRFSDYNTLITSNSESSSLGSKLRSSQNPVLKIVNVFYTALTPIPPPILKTGFSLGSMLISFGAVIWYVVLPGFFMSIKWGNIETRRSLRRLNLSFSLFFLTVIIFVSLSSGDQRHLILLYPFTILQSIIYIYFNKVKYQKFLFFYIIIAIALIGVYVTLKFF